MINELYENKPVVFPERELRSMVRFFTGNHTPTRQQDQTNEIDASGWVMFSEMSGGTFRTVPRAPRRIVGAPVEQPQALGPFSLRYFFNFLPFPPGLIKHLCCFLTLEDFFVCTGVCKAWSAQFVSVWLDCSQDFEQSATFLDIHQKYCMLKPNIIQALPFASQLWHQMMQNTFTQLQHWYTQPPARQLLAAELIISARQIFLDNHKFVALFLQMALEQPELSVGALLLKLLMMLVQYLNIVTDPRFEQEKIFLVSARFATPTEAQFVSLIIDTHSRPWFPDLLLLRKNYFTLLADHVDVLEQPKNRKQAESHIVRVTPSWDDFFQHICLPITTLSSKFPIKIPPLRTLGKIWNSCNINNNNNTNNNDENNNNNNNNTNNNDENNNNNNNQTNNKTNNNTILKGITENNEKNNNNTTNCKEQLLCPLIQLGERKEIPLDQNNLWTFHLPQEFEKAPPQLFVPTHEVITCIFEPDVRHTSLPLKFPSPEHAIEFPATYFVPQFTFTPENSSLYTPTTNRLCIRKPKLHIEDCTLKLTPETAQVNSSQKATKKDPALVYEFEDVHIPCDSDARLPPSQALLLDQHPVHWTPLEVSVNTPHELGELHGFSSNCYKGCIYIFGGANTGKSTNHLWRFDISKRTWDRLFPTVVPVDDEQATTSTIADQLPFLSDHSAVEWRGQLIVFGGRGHAGRIRNIQTKHPQILYNDVYCYDIAKNQWCCMSPVMKGSIPNRKAHVAQVVGNKMIVYGGWNNKTSFNDLYELDLESWAWRALIPRSGWSPPPARDLVSAAWQQRLYIWGGGGPRAQTLQPIVYNRMHYFDLDTECWCDVDLTKGPRPPPAESHMAVCCEDLLFIFGGTNLTTFFQDLYVFDFVTERFHHLLQDNCHNHSIPTPRACGGLLTYNDSLFLVGGYGPSPSGHGSSHRDQLYWNRYNDVWMCDLLRIKKYLSHFSKE